MPPAEGGGMEISMDKITDIVYITIRELIQKSKWGQEVTTDNIIIYCD